MTCRKSPSLHISNTAQSLSLALAFVGLASTTSTLPSQAAPLKASTAAPPSQQSLDPPAPGVLTPGYPLANGHFLQGLKLKKEGKKGQALVEFLQAVKENPRFTQALYEQALIFREKGFTKLALSALSQAIKIDPSFKDARLLSATIKLESGDTLAAQSELSAGLGLPSLSMVSSTRANSSAVTSNSNTSSPFPSTSKSTTATASKSAGATITFGNNNQPQLAPAARLKTAPSATTRAAIKADDATCVAPFPGNFNGVAARQENQKNRLSFTPDATTGKGSGITNNIEAYSNLKVEKRTEEAVPEDEWVSKLRYLAKNGTASLRPGEAFMFAEDSGEAVLFLGNGQKIRRLIAKPKDKQTIVKERRPDMLLPQDVMVKLSTLGKLVAQDPARALEIATDTELQKMLSTPAPKKNQDTYGDYHDNSFLDSPYLKETELERNSAKAIDARLNKKLDDSPFSDEGNSSLPQSTASSSGKKNSELTSILDAEGKSHYLDDYQSAGNKESLNSNIPNGQANSAATNASAGKNKAADPLKEFENELPADSFMEKTQKFFSWIRKSLNF